MTEAHMRSNGISRQVKSIIATECGIEVKSVNNKTNFMNKSNISYFECVDALYTLEHKLHVKLPESSYYKYTTVGGVVKDIVRQLKVRSK